MRYMSLAPPFLRIAFSSGSKYRTSLGLSIETNKSKCTKIARFFDLVYQSSGDMCDITDIELIDRVRLRNILLSEAAVSWELSILTR